MFGCQMSETGLFITQLADGIMGMSADSSTLVKQLYDKHKIQHNMFSLCFGRDDYYSKEGIYAGSMTIGRSNSVFHNTKMVYAADVTNGGWFTVHVEAIYLRKGGGQHVRPDSSKQTLHRVEVDMNHVNNGKGVIVDSGTTDTYFMSAVRRPFMDLYKKLYGKDWTNKAMKLTKKEIEEMPTIVFQLRAYNRDDEFLNPENTDGLAGSIDPNHPNDVIFSMPATHYLEYLPSTDTYTARFYTDESSGGVLGANAMVGHDILFDWENQRIGFAESDCNYNMMAEGLHNNNSGKPGSSEDNRLDNVGKMIDKSHDTDIVNEKIENPEAIFILNGDVNCVLLPPEITVACRDSIGKPSMDRCTNNDAVSTKIAGTESSIRIVKSPGTGNGLSCEAVGRKNYHKTIKSTNPLFDFLNNSYKITCIDGECSETKKCEMTCQELVEEIENPDFLMAGEGPCTSPWGACRWSCDQVRHIGERYDDKCYKTNEETRPCHTGGCAMDACKVPFKVHLAVGFERGNATLWSLDEEEVFAHALSRTLGSGIMVGDIDIIGVSDWTRPNIGLVLGMKITLEISIFAPNYLKLIKEKKCEDGTVLQEYAQRGNEISKTLNTPKFLAVLVKTCKSLFAKASKDKSKKGNPFAIVPLDGTSELLENWSVKMKVGQIGSFEDDDIVPKNTQINVMKKIVVLGLVLFTGCFFAFCWRVPTLKEFEGFERRISREGKSHGTHTSSLMEKMRRRISSSPQKYSKLGIDTDNNESEFEMGGVSGEDRNMDI
mmetsp:Transcript_38831/g.90315  ORF Transcript_38831/g.90315 Transcript_38831/m.90315 type:complete len:771 (-) Transcript_38831:251-2563(-)